MPETWELSEAEKGWIRSGAQLSSEAIEGYGLREQLKAALSSQGLSIDDAGVQKTVKATAEVLLSEIERQRMNAVGDLLWTRKEKFRKSLDIIQIVGLAAGLVGLLASLVGGFGSFQEAIKRIIGANLDSYEGLVASALAQAAQPPALIQSPALLPVFVYLIYVLVSIAYVVTLFAVFLGKEAKDKANAMTVFQNLNAFFIGVLSGKIV